LHCRRHKPYSGLLQVFGVCVFRVPGTMYLVLYLYAKRHRSRDVRKILYMDILLEYYNTSIKYHIKQHTNTPPQTRKRLSTGLSPTQLGSLRACRIMGLSESRIEIFFKKQVLWEGISHF
jgi:hypothetical protein